MSDLLIPDNKQEMLKGAQDEVDEITNNYNMGFITNNERYNQVIDIWTRVNNRISETLNKALELDRQGFNSVYMMLHPVHGVLKSKCVSWVVSAD